MRSTSLPGKCKKSYVNGFEGLRNDPVAVVKSINESIYIFLVNETR